MTLPLPQFGNGSLYGQEELPKPVIVRVCGSDPIMASRIPKQAQVRPRSGVLPDSLASVSAAAARWSLCTSIT